MRPIVYPKIFGVTIPCRISSDTVSNTDIGCLEIRKSYLGWCSIECGVGPSCSLYISLNGGYQDLLRLPSALFNIVVMNAEVSMGCQFWRVKALVVVTDQYPLIGQSHDYYLVGESLREYGKCHTTNITIRQTTSQSAYLIYKWACHSPCISAVVLSSQA